MAKSGRSSTGMKIDATDLYKLQEAFKACGKEAQKAAREETNKIGKAMRSELQGAGLVMQGALTAHVARKGIKYERKQVFQGRDGVIRASKFSGGYLPVVAIGGNVTLPVSRKATDKNPHPTANEVWAGTEFGSNAPFLPKGGKRFRPRRDEGYWFYPTWESIKGDYYDKWIQAMREVMDSFDIKKQGGFR